MQLLQNKDIEPPKQEINFSITIGMILCMLSSVVISYTTKDIYTDYGWTISGIPLYHSIILNSILIYVIFYIILKLFKIYDDSISSQIGIYSGILFVIVVHIYNTYNLFDDIIVSINMIIIIFIICTSITRKPPYSKNLNKYFSKFYSAKYNIYKEDCEYLIKLRETLNFDYIVYFLQDNNRFIEHPDKNYIFYSEHVKTATFTIWYASENEIILSFDYELDTVNFYGNYLISGKEFKIIKQIMGWN